MISVIRKTDQQGDDVYEVYCKSTDEKPTEGITNASTLFEMDTKSVYMFDEDTATWLPL